MTNLDHFRDINQFLSTFSSKKKLDRQQWGGQPFPEVRRAPGHPTLDDNDTIDLPQDPYPRPDSFSSSRTPSLASSKSTQSSRSSSVSSVFSTDAPSSTAPTAMLPRRMEPGLAATLAGHLPVHRSNLLPCEFQVYGDCQASFDRDDTEGWIDHAITHLREQLPIRCVCWFCDDIEFDAAESGGNVSWNFRLRMEHIWSHLIDDQTIDQYRPDYPFLRHLYQQRLISNDIYHLALRFQEGSRPHLSDIYPHDFMPPKREHETEVLNQVPHDLAREERKARRSGKGLVRNTKNPTNHRSEHPSHRCTFSSGPN